MKPIYCYFYISLILTALVGGCASGPEVDPLAEVKLTLSQMETIAEALERYKKRCGSYPTQMQGLQALEAPPIRKPLCKKWGPEPYMVEVPLDAWDNFFNYSVENGEFTLQSLGADKREGGEGVNADISREE